MDLKYFETQNFEQMCKENDYYFNFPEKDLSYCLILGIDIS